MSRLGTVFVLLVATLGFAPSQANADVAQFTLVSPVNNQQVKLGAANNWYLPIRVSGTAPSSDSHRFTANFYDSAGDVAATVTWDIYLLRQINTNVDWTFKVGLSNLRYVENPSGSAIGVPRDDRGVATLTATKIPFKNGTLKPGIYSFELFVTNLSNAGERVTIGDIAGLQIGTPAGVKCAPGSFSKTGTWTSKAACTSSSRGYLSASVGSKTQKPTAAGTFVRNPGSAFSAKCMEGTYQPRAGQASCLNASPGNFVSAVGAIKQLPCPVGKYTARAGTFSCYIAEPGTYVPSPGKTAATNCPVGKYQTNAGKSFCTPAQAGYFVGITHATAPIPCEPGTYQNETGKATCKDTTPGHFTNSMASTMQFECSPGTFAPFAQSRECLDAPTGTFVTTSGAITATACPAGLTTFATRSASASDCVPAG